MSGWLAMPADAWPEIAEALPQPWPDSAAAMDLRWYVDRKGSALRGTDPTAAELVKGLPGRPTLAKRWGWTDHKVRTLLAAVDRWWDEGRWGPPLRSSSPADRQPTASASPADRQPVNGSSSTIEHESPADRQPTASASPADRHTRGDPPTPTPSPPPEKNKISASAPEGAVEEGWFPRQRSRPNEAAPQPLEDAPTAPDHRAEQRKKRADDFAAAVACWNDEVVPILAKRNVLVPTHPKLSPGNGLGAELGKAIGRHGLPDVLLVLRWYARGDHPTVTFLHEKALELPTLLKKFDAYVDAARIPAPKVGRHAHDPPEPAARSPASPRRLSREEEAAELERLSQLEREQKAKNRDPRSPP